ncbi:MAG TPA: U32 family peptidase [Anaerolineaceae bacterium]
MDKIELLAPAKDLESGQAAINCGADAIYIGGARFGAREAAGNSLGDIEALVAYAHRYWARVYVTLNTLLYDSELPQAESMARSLYETGADALIIQDAALLEMDLPPIPLFASTQMHNHTPERVAFLEKVGIQRVILARELSLEQIRAIRAATTVELETFVHGALCVSYSGQCYLSYALGGRSGNRGQCAQPCRRPYQLVDRSGNVVQQSRYLLSLRDLNLSDDLPALLDAGISSFKIEGRLKDKTYVMNVVGHYRQQLDRLLEGKPLRTASSGRVHFDFTPNPTKTFNRGFTSYFLHGRKEPVGSPDTPKSLGEPVGRAVKLTRNAFQLDGKAEIHRGDGLCYFDKQRALLGTTVNDVQGRLIFPEKMDGIEAETPIYRNHDHAFLTALEKSQVERKIAVRFRLAATSSGIALFAQDEDGCETMFAVAAEKTLAEKPDQALATIDKQLRKLGGTPFECINIRVDLPEAYFIPLSTLNALRRGVLEQLEAQRDVDFPRQQGGAIRNNVPYPAQELTYLGNVLNAKAREFYRRHGVIRIEPAAESGLVMNSRKVMTTKHCIKHQLDYCLKYSPGAKDRPRPQEPLALVDEQGICYPLRFDCAQCVMEVYFGGSEESV